MIAAATHQTQARPRPIAPPSDNLTRVDILWIEKQTEQWIRFGREVGEQIIDRRRRIVAFESACVQDTSAMRRLFDGPAATPACRAKNFGPKSSVRRPRSKPILKRLVSAEIGGLPPVSQALHVPPLVGS